MEQPSHNTLHDITAEDISEIEKEPGDVSDIIQDIPEKEKLDQLKKLIDSLPQEDIIKLLSQLGEVDTVNPINPNENKFSTTTQKEMRRRKYKIMLERKRQERMTVSAKKKMQEKMNEKKNQENTKQKDKIDGSIIDVDSDDESKKFTINGVD